MTSMEELETRKADLTAALDKVEAEMKVKRDEAWAEQRAAIDSKYMESCTRMMGLPDEAFYADPSDVKPWSDERYVLPFGNEYAQFNPHDDACRENHEFGPVWTANMTALICKKDERTRPTRLIWTSGYAAMDHPSNKIGMRFQARHDQTNARLGEYEIVGLAFFGPTGKLARVVGEVPDRKFPQSTYK